MAAEDKRQERAKRKIARDLADLSIDRREDIDDLYGYGIISERKRDRLVELFEETSGPDELYQAKLDLLQDAYATAQQIMRDYGQEV